MSHEVLIDRLCSMVSADKLRDLTMELVRIPSPTGDSVAVSELYAERVGELGLPVEILREYPSSPSTVARLGTSAGARTLTLDGHLDTIHTPHPEPEFRNNCIYGRGSGDMKAGVAAMVEATRVLIESGVELGGNLTLFTHTLHEAPVGHMEALKAALARGDIFVDAAIVAESGFDTLSVCGKGQMLFEIDVNRDGTVMHENVGRPKGVSNPLDFAARLANAFLEADQRLAGADQPYPLIGPETFFLGQIHGGDFYNRIPNHAFLNGIHRFWPDKEWADVEGLYQEIVDSVPRGDDIEIDMRLAGNGLGWEMDPRNDIVRAMQEGYATIVGRELPLVSALSVCDANVIVREGGVPTVAHGTGSTTAHADLEWVDLTGVVRTTKVFLASIINYLGVAD